LKVVGREFDFHAISWQNLNVISANFAGNMRQNVKTVVEIDAEHGVRQRFRYRAFHFNEILFSHRQFLEVQLSTIEDTPKIGVVALAFFKYLIKDRLDKYQTLVSWQ